jgi:hypothetical protein
MRLVIKWTKLSLVLIIDRSNMVDVEMGDENTTEVFKDK